MPVAALPVTQQMTEMSISREDKVTTPKTEVSEPGMVFIWFFNLCPSPVSFAPTHQHFIMQRLEMSRI